MMRRFRVDVVIELEIEADTSDEAYHKAGDHPGVKEVIGVLREEDEPVNGSGT